MEGQHNVKCDVERRMASYLIDHIILCFVTVGFIIYRVISGNFKIITLGIIGATLIFIGKDLFGGRSIGKRVFSMAVRNVENIEEVPEKWRLFLRNITLLIWPIEVIVLLVRNDKRRLGDVIAGTTVIRIVNQKKVSKKKVIVIGVILGIVIIVGGFSAIIKGFSGMIKNSAPYKTTIEFIESSEELEDRIGEIKGYGFLRNASINITNGYGEAVFIITVNGEKETVKIYSELVKEPGSEWEIVQIDYVE